MTLFSVRSLLAAALFAMVLPGAGFTQDDEPTFIVVDYIQVRPENAEDYRALEKVAQKVHHERIRQGNLTAWYAEELISPTGTAEPYSFVTTNVYTGKDMLYNHFNMSIIPDNWENLLSEEEAQLGMRTHELREVVKTELYQVVDEPLLGDEWKDATIQVWNYFRNDEGVTTQDNIRVTLEVAKPIHEARIESGGMAGWVMLYTLLPLTSASSTPYQSLTIDLYADLNQLMGGAQTSWSEYAAMAHAGEDPEALRAKLKGGKDLVRADVRRRINFVYADGDGRIVSMNE